MKDRAKKISKIVFKVLLYFVAGLALLFLGVFIAMRLHLTNVKGSVDSASQYFNDTQDKGAREKEALKFTPAGT